MLFISYYYVRINGSIRTLNTHSVEIYRCSMNLRVPILKNMEYIIMFANSSCRPILK